MTQLIARVFGTCGAMVTFKKVKDPDGVWVWETKFPVKVTTCPACSGSDLETRSPISCKQCGEEIGTMTKEGKLRVRGKPFKNWTVSPFDGLLILRVETLRQKL